jgi:hypothetical protein
MTHTRTQASLVVLWRCLRIGPTTECLARRYRVYHMRGERFTDQCVYESDRFGGGGVMVWVGICHDGRTQLKIVQGPTCL